MYEDEITINFAKLIVLGKGEAAVTFDKVTLREPLAGELEKASRADTAVGVVISLISLVGGVPRGVAEKMSNRDFQAANRFLESFTASGQQAGAAGQS